MTAVSQFWLGGCFEEFLTFQMEAHVARFGWLVYILSNTSLWGTENCIPSRKCQTVVAGLCWHCAVILFWSVLAEVDTCLPVDRKNSDLHLQSARANKQHLMWLAEIKHPKEVSEQRKESFLQEWSENIRAWVCISEATVSLNKGKRCCKGYS